MESAETKKELKNRKFHLFFPFPILYIIDETVNGETTFSALASFIKPRKIVSIEDTQELNVMKMGFIKNISKQGM